MTTQKQYLQNEAAKASLRADILRAERWRVITSPGGRSADLLPRHLQAGAEHQDDVARILARKARKQ